MIVSTIGELKAALDGMDDAIPLARPAHIGGFWRVGQLQVGSIDLVEVGRRRKDREIIAVGGWMDTTFKGWRGKPYRALAFGA